MEAQLSFEFLIYLAVSAASLALMLGIFVHAQAAQDSEGARAYAEELAQLLGSQNSTYHIAPYNQSCLCAPRNSIVSRLAVFGGKLYCLSVGR
jgi:hypothetical protein